MDFTKGLCMGCMNQVGENQICPSCGFDNMSADNGVGLPVRAMLGKYVIGRVLDSGGEGITYIGMNTETGESVRIREFFPAGLCERAPDGTVVINKEDSFSFNEALICFLELARSLSSFNGNGHLLEVTDIFEAGNTAYFVTENVSGITLREFLLRNGGQLTWEQARSLFAPLFNVINQLHEANIIHRGISPETLLVGRDGRIRITGFCIASARTARSDISARLFPGFAAIEQYGFDAKSGPWTDVYGLAATIFRTIVGNPPPEATERVSQDNMTVPARLAEELPKSVLSALANALQIMPESRTKSVELLKEGLMAETTATVSNKEETAVKGNPFFKKYGVLIIAAAGTLLLLLIATFTIPSFKNIFLPGESTGNTDIDVPTSSKVILDDEDEIAKAIDCRGMTCAEVLEYYEEEGFKDIKIEVVAKEYNDKYKRGEIFKQDTKKDSKLREKDYLKVYVSLGKEEVTLPDFVEKETNYKDAKIKLLEMGFISKNIVEVGVTKLGEDEEIVFNMEPAGGTKVSVESKVKISYYKEIEEIIVENFVGKNYNDDVQVNEDYSAYQFEVEEVYSEVYDEGIIIKQSIPKGTTIKNTETLVLTVSRGEPPTMPSLRGRLESDATNYFQRKDVSYTIIEQYSSDVAKGRVIKTNPREGQTITGDVIIYVSKGEDPKSTVSSQADSSGLSESQIIDSITGSESENSGSDSSKPVVNKPSSKPAVNNPSSNSTASNSASKPVANNSSVSSSGVGSSAGGSSLAGSSAESSSVTSSNKKPASSTVSTNNSQSSTSDTTSKKPASNTTSTKPVSSVVSNSSAAGSSDASSSESSSSKTSAVESAESETESATVSSNTASEEGTSSGVGASSEETSSVDPEAETEE